MRSLIHSLAVVAVILSGITAGDLRALAGVADGPVEAHATQSVDGVLDASVCCGDDTISGDMHGPMAADNDTSDCHTTSVFLPATHAALHGPLSAPCFDARTEDAVGTSLAPTGPPPKFAV